ncbi:MAG TPA: ATP-binding protein, partial [Anaerolineae bacterium]|nr:ATP-binding protein [Anaerolineae bacterium]
LPTGSGLPTSTLRFIVTDTGIGIAPEDLNLVFEPFRQVGRQERRAGGTGLGLNICCNLLELMGSQLSVTSEIGLGTTFWFDLALPEITSGVKVDLPHRWQRVIGIKGQAPRLLVIDPDPASRSMLLETLAPLGLEIASAGSGRDGVEKAKTMQPHLIIVNLAVPHFEDPALISKLRLSSTLSSVSILGFAPALETGAVEPLPLGGDGDIVLEAPLEVGRLLEMLEQLTDITWKYQDELKPDPSVGEAVEPLTPPTPDDLHSLSDLVLVGDLRAIKTWVDDLERQDVRYQPFANRVRQLAQSFQVEELKQLLVSLSNNSR